MSHVKMFPERAPNRLVCVSSQGHQLKNMKSGRQKRELKFSRRFFLTITILFTITFYISSFLLEPGEGKFKQ